MPLLASLIPLINFYTNRVIAPFSLKAEFRNETGILHMDSFIQSSVVPEVLLCPRHCSRTRTAMKNKTGKAPAHVGCPFKQGVGDLAEST